MHTANPYIQNAQAPSHKAAVFCNMGLRFFSWSTEQTLLKAFKFYASVVCFYITALQNQISSNIFYARTWRFYLKNRCPRIKNVYPHIRLKHFYKSLFVFYVSLKRFYARAKHFYVRMKHPYLKKLFPYMAKPPP